MRDIEIGVAVHSKAWQELCPEAATLAEDTARCALLDAGPAGAAPVVVGVVLTDDAEQRRLNHAYRGIDKPTNVLSFALGEAPAARGVPLLLGDVVLACETVAREAAEQKKPVSDHLRHLVVHGVLHLCGFDHENATEAAIMEAREVEILKSLGVADPYRDTM